MKTFLYKHNLLITLLVVTLLWVALYNNFIFGQYFYVYTDIGADAWDNYLPNYKLLVDAIKSGNFNTWSFTMCTGNNVFTLFTLILDPLLPVLLIPYAYLPSLILLITYIKIICIATLFYKLLEFFYVKQNSLLMLGTILYVFNSYIIIWGQHYFFLTGFLYFTFLLYGIEHFIRTTKIRYLFISLLLFLLGSIYFLFYAIPFFLGYIIVRLSTEKKWFYLKKYFWQILIVLTLSLLISMVSVLPVLDVLQSSPRTVAAFNYPIFYDYRAIIENLSKFYNPMWLSIDNPDTVMRFYDFLVYTSCLFPLLLIPYVFSDTPGKLKRFFFLILFAIPTISIFVSAIFNKFSTADARYTFFYAVIEVFVILNVLNHKTNRKLIILSTTFNLCLITYITNYLNLLTNFNIYVVYLIVITYSIILLCAPKRRLLILGLVLCAEIFYFNYQVVFLKRTTMSTEQVKNKSSYYDQTDKIATSIHEQDDEFYRIYRNYMSTFLNDPSYFNYYGFDEFSSLYNQSYSLFRYTNFYMDNGYVNDTWRISAHRGTLNNGLEHYLFLYTLLNAKYFIAKDGKHQIPYGYSKDFARPDIGYTVYKNNFFLPVGLFFKKNECVSYTTFAMQNKLVKQDLLANYYITESCINDNFTISHGFSNTSNTVLNNYVLTNQNEHKFIGKYYESGSYSTFVHFRQQESYLILKIKFESSHINLNNHQGTIYVKSSLNDFNDLNKAAFEIDDSGNTTVYLEYPSIADLRIDLIDKNISYTDLSIEKINFDTYTQAIESLKNRTIAFNYSRKHPNVFTIKYTAPEAGLAVLFIPYDKFWHAQINDYEVNIRRTDIGFISIPVTQGVNNIRIYYSNNIFWSGFYLTAVGLFFALLLYIRFRSKSSN